MIQEIGYKILSDLHAIALLLGDMADVLVLLRDRKRVESVVNNITVNVIVIGDNEKETIKVGRHILV